MGADGDGDGAAAHPYILFALGWWLCFLIGDPLFDYVFEGHHVAHSPHLSKRCKVILQVTFATITALLSLLAVESMALVHPAALHRLWALSLAGLCLLLNVVIPAFAGLYCSSYCSITRTPLVTLISSSAVYIFHVCVRALARLVVHRPDGPAWSAAALLRSLWSVHFSAWRLAVVGTVIAGAVAGFATVNAVVDEWLLLRGHGASAAVRRATEHRQAVADSLDRVRGDIESIARMHNLPAAADGSRAASCSGPGMWSKQSAVTRLSRLRAGERRLARAGDEAAATLLLLQELHGRRAQSRAPLGRAVRAVTVGLCVLAVYRLGAVALAEPALLLAPAPSPSLVGGTKDIRGMDAMAVAVAYNGSSPAVGPPAAGSMADTALSEVRAARSLSRWYPVLSFVVLGGIAAAQFSGLLSTVHILLRLEPSARSTEAFSLALAYLAGSDFMACLLLLQRQFPSIKQVGFSEAFGASFADSAAAACARYFNIVYVLSSAAFLLYLYKNKIRRVALGQVADARALEKELWSESPTGRV